MGEAITIVGGGLAGLTLGIALRQREVPVALWEAGEYPRHRVCGEFISGHGQRSMERLGLIDLLKPHQIRHAANAAFFLGGKESCVRSLPEPALCISRYVLDETLAAEFERLGGELHAGERWRGEASPGVVRASGRRPEAVADGWRWFGLKVHAAGVALTADLEMHFVPSGYVGLCRLPGGEVNICGLFRNRTPVSDLARAWREWLRGPKDSALRARLADADFDEKSFCSIAALSLGRRRAADLGECSVGDALTMIPPVTGNGMSMAFESAELAVEPLTAFSHEGGSWPAAQQQVAAACDARFGRRLAWASVLQRALFIPSLRPALFFMAARSGFVWRALFERTR